MNARYKMVALGVATVAASVSIVVWLREPGVYTRTATITYLNSGSESQDDRPMKEDTGPLSAVSVDWSIFEDTRPVAAQLALDRGGSVDEYVERISIDITSDNAKVTATGQDASDTVGLANDAARILVEQFDGISDVPGLIELNAELTEPAR